MPQGRNTLVPGFMAGMEAAHARFGRLPWPRLFEPSIWHARTG
ncbi:gamma-glutamyltransferase [Brevundimonas sp. R86498]